MNRKSLILLFVVLVWLNHLGYLDNIRDKIIDVVSPEPATVSIVAFVKDNDAPDLDLDVEVTKAANKLRETHDVVVIIDDTPASVGSLQQGELIIGEAKSLGGEAIVLVGEDDTILRSVALPKISDEMVRWVDAS